MPIHSILDTDPHLLVSFTISNLKKKQKYLMTSLLENCFFSMPTHSMPTQYAYTVCLIMPIPSILDTDPHLLVSFTISNLKKKTKIFYD